MKKIIAMIMCAVMAVSMGACGDGESDAPMGFKEISDKDVDYDLYVPESWVTDISTGVTSARYSDTDPTNISVMAFELDGSVSTIPEYWASYEPSLKAVFADLTYEGGSEGDKVKLDGYDALQYTYTGRLGDSKYKFMQIVTFKGSTVFIFTYTAEEGRYETAKGADGNETEKYTEIGSYDKHLEDVLAILGYFNFN